jgi:hypothetical protein
MFRPLLAGLLALALMSCATRQPDAPTWAAVSKEIGKW